MSLPEISTVPNLSTTDRANILDALFEPCTALHTLSIDLFHTQTFSSYDDLIASVGMQLTELSESSSTTDTAWLHSILAAHPRLGASKVDSVQSRAEQAQLNTGAADEAEKLKHANDLYEQTFPGLIYVVFVNGRSRPEVIKDMYERIERNDANAERAAAIKAMCDIAADRARKLQSQAI